MSLFTTVAIAAILIWAFFYTVSFGWWTWKKENRLGAVMVFIVALVTVGLPVYAIFFKD